MKKDQIKIVPFDNYGFHGVKFINTDGKEVSLSFEKNSPRSGLCIFDNQKNITHYIFKCGEMSDFEFSDVKKALKYINAI